MATVRYKVVMILNVEKMFSGNDAIDLQEINGQMQQTVL
jgi:hypothetical protein